MTAGLALSAKTDDFAAFDKAFASVCAVRINRDHSRGDNVQLFAQSKRSVWRKRDIDAPGLNANGTGKPGNLRLCADKGARHLTKLSFSERPHATPEKGVTRAGVAQASSEIYLCTGRAPLQIGRLELHFIGHFHQLCRARAQACRLGQALVTLCSRQSTGSQVDHIHFPASYSRAHSARLVAGVTPEAKGNTP